MSETEIEMIRNDILGLTCDLDTLTARVAVLEKTARLDEMAKEIERLQYELDAIPTIKALGEKNV